MPRFTLKMNISPSMSVVTPYINVEISEQGLFFQDDQFEGSHV